VLGSVGQRLLSDVEERRARALVEDFLDARLHLELDLHQCVGPELMDELAQALAQVVGFHALRAHVHDVVADVTDGLVKAIDGVTQAVRRRLRIVLQQQGAMLKRQANGINRLDNAIVQIHPDPLALLQHRQAAHLLVQAGVLDRHCRI